ncbi:type II secretion system protein N [Massilia luteola]|uniref:type II secretion system protein N n=1 Tax=Massilia luteola TaxID=3081751 RepID=UPI002ACC2806|nr:type II secretion system protein N [Massilia sp. Gc5]
MLPATVPAHRNTHRKTDVKHLPLAAAVTLFSAVCASGAYWGLPWFQPPVRAVVAASRADVAPPSIDAAAGLFGGAPAGPAASAFQLKGVIDAGPEGVAILAADGKPAQAVGIGSEVGPGVRVREIHQRYVLLDDGGALKRLDLPDSAVAGLSLVAAAAPSGAPARAAPPLTPATVARSGGPMPPPVMDPHLARTPGQAPDPIRQMQETQQMQQMQRMHRPAGVGPAAFGAKPVG